MPKKSLLELAKSESGVVHLLIPILIIAVVAAAAFALIYFGVIKNPVPQVIQTQQESKKEPTVSLQTKYQNPFDKSAQYVNPFSEYKNPFDTLKTE